MGINCVDIKNRLNRLQGQLSGVEKMIESERDSIEIVHQISAIRAALAKLAVEILKEESSECFKQKTRKEKLQAFEDLVESFFKIQ